MKGGCGFFVLFLGRSKSSDGSPCPAACAQLRMMGIPSMLGQLCSNERATFVDGSTTGGVR